MKKKLAILILFILFLIPTVKAITDITNCQEISSTGEYRIVNDINAVTPAGSCGGISCICIRADNVTLNSIVDGREYKIFNTNSSILTGISVTPPVSVLRSLSITGGVIENFTNGLVFSCAGVSCVNVEVSNLKLYNNFNGLVLANVNDSYFRVAVDQPNTGQAGIHATWTKNITINAFSRAITFGALLEDISNSSISGHYDTNIIITTNQTTFGGNLLNMLSFGLIPPTVLGTRTVQEQSKGLGIFVNKSYGTIYHDISAFGLVQGIAVENANYNLFARINLPANDLGKVGYGQFGGIFFGINTVNNVLCEINDLIGDKIYTVVYEVCSANNMFTGGSASCGYKNNTYIDSCSGVSANSYPQKSTLQSLFLTPLITFNVPPYTFISFLFTPFFLGLSAISGISVYIAIMSKNILFGEIVLTIFVFLFSLVSVVTFFFGLIFVLIMGYIIINQQKGAKHE
jgi:hypothetical protein